MPMVHRPQTVISEAAPKLLKPLAPPPLHQIPLPDTSDSDDETLFRIMLTVMCLIPIMLLKPVQKHLYPTLSISDVTSNNHYLWCKSGLPAQTHTPTLPRLDKTIYFADKRSDLSLPGKSRQSLRHSLWIEAMRKKLEEFDVLDVGIMVPCPDYILSSRSNGFSKLSWMNDVTLLDREAIRLFIALAESMNLVIFQIGREKPPSSTGELIEVVMLVNRRICDPETSIRMFLYRLRKALYDLKQLQREWYRKLSAFLIKSGFTKGVVDPTLFTRGEKQGKHVPLYKYRISLMKCNLLPIKRIFRYLKGTINMGLWYPKDSGFELKAFADADYAGCHDTRRSTSGFSQFLEIGLLAGHPKSRERKSSASHTEVNTSPSPDAESCIPLFVLKSSWMRSQLRDYGF
ncbi:retrovirus-related pol polyprotein from transposon TNT 1-94 [Tanacetum coccineum]